MTGQRKVRIQLLVLATFITILSQVPFIRITLGIDTQMLVYPAWLIVAFLSFFPKFQYKSREILKPILYIVSILGLICLYDVISPKQYLFSNETTLIMPLIISALMLAVGYTNAKYIGLKELKRISLAYIVATMILSLDIYMEFLQGVSLNSVTYAFSAKNSSGQMILTAIVLLIYMATDKRWKLAVKIVCIVMLTVILVMMRSRASIASLGIIPVMYIFESKISKKKKWALSTAIIAVVVLILSQEALFDFFIRNILLNTTSGKPITIDDLTRITSNRSGYFDTFRRLFKGNALMGIGAYYMDNFFLNAFLNYGVIVGIILSIFATYPMQVSFGAHIRDNNVRLTIKTLAVIYFANGFFEALAPFGPGTKCFLLWFLTGILINKKNQLRLNRAGLSGKEGMQQNG